MGRDGHSLGRRSASPANGRVLNEVVERLSLAHTVAERVEIAALLHHSPHRGLGPLARRRDLRDLGVHVLLGHGDPLALRGQERLRFVAALDAGIIASAQKSEHYEIATYGTLAYYAELLGNERAKSLLGETLDEEKAAEEEARFDERYGVDTRAEVVPRRLTVDDDSLAHGNRYGTILPHEFHEIFKQFKLNHEDFAFVDLGSGKGRVLMLAADYPFALNYDLD